MIDFEYAARNMRGVWDAIFAGKDLDHSVDHDAQDVIRSFQAVAIAAPFSILSVAFIRIAALKSTELETDPLITGPYSVFMAAKMAAFATDWMLSIGVLIAATQLFNVKSRLARAITAFNWSQAIAAIALLVPVAILGITQDVALFSVVYLPAFIFALVVTWKILRMALELDIGTTIALIAVLGLTSLMANELITIIAITLIQGFS